jgi:hypothetical protein
VVFRLHDAEHAGESARRTARDHLQSAACGYHRISMSAFDARMDRVGKTSKWTLRISIEKKLPLIQVADN